MFKALEIFFKVIVPTFISPFSILLIADSPVFTSNASCVLVKPCCLRNNEILSPYFSKYILSASFTCKFRGGAKYFSHIFVRL
jgi:hypothetical protein